MDIQLTEEQELLRGSLQRLLARSLRLRRAPARSWRLTKAGAESTGAPLSNSACARHHSKKVPAVLGGGPACDDDRDAGISGRNLVVEPFLETVVSRRWA